MQKLVQAGNVAVARTHEPNSSNGFAEHLKARESRFLEVHSDGLTAADILEHDSRRLWSHAKSLGFKPTFRGYATPQIPRDAKPWERQQLETLQKVDYVNRLRHEQTSVPPPPFASHTAAHLLGIPTITPHPAELVRHVGPRGSCSKSRHVRTVRLSYEPDTVSFLEFEVTSPAQTVIDLSRFAGAADGLICANYVLNRKLATRDEILAILEELPRVAGINQARRVAALMDGRIQSPGESLTFLRLVDHGLPPVEPQMQFDFGFGRQYPDFTDLKHQIIYEFHGKQKLLDPTMVNDLDYRASIENEGLRDLYFRQAGYPSFHLRWVDVATPEGFQQWLMRARADGLPV